MGYIYTITNTDNGKILVGQTHQNPPRARWLGHLSELRRGVHSNSYLQRAYDKVGEQAWKFDIIAETDTVEQLNELESHYINQYNTLISSVGYNLREGGLNGRMSEETKRKMSVAQTGRTHSIETCAKISKSNKGKKVSDETRLKISESKKGTIPPIEARKNMSDAQRGRIHSEETKHKISLANKGKIVSEETRQKLHKTTKELWKDPGFRKRVSEGQRKVHRNRDKNGKFIGISEKRK